jgi:ankyrin repeat protein
MRIPLCLSTAVLACVCFGAESNALFTAIRNNDLAAVKTLTAATGAANVAGDRETTPLLYAGAYGSVEAMKILLAAGADVNAKNAFGATALMLSVTEPAKIRLLVDHGADVNAKSKAGRTALILAALHNGSDGVMDVLLAKGADTKPADKDGMTFLLAASNGMNPREVRLAIEKGADVNAKDGSGFTALMNAASNGDLESVKFLLSKGADANAVSTSDKFGKVKNGNIDLGNFTALMVAAPYGPPEIVERLLRAGAKVDAQDIRGMTALHYAVATEAQHPEIVRLLLKAGADPAVKMRNGESALDWAAKFSNPQVMALLPVTARPARPAVQEGIAKDLTARAGAMRGMKLLEKVSGEFLKTGGCFSCHAQNITALAASYAKAHGLPVDDALQQGQLAGDRAFFAGTGDQLLLRFDPPGGIDTLDYTLLHFSAAGQKSDPAVDPLIHNVAAEQMADGSWHSGGVARAPMADSDIVRTALSVRAIRHFAWEGRKADLAAHVGSARTWLRAAKPVYNEEHVMQLLGLKWAGETNLGALPAKLIAQQREDGGWAQNANLASDAYATGQTLFALAETGLAPSSPVYRRGVDFLLRTQAADGSWHVASRAPKLQPYFQSGFPYDHDQWISMAGTAWATMALTMAAEPQQQVAAR